MSKKAFEKIAKGLREALSVARGKTKPSKLHVPPESALEEVGTDSDDSDASF